LFYTADFCVVVTKGIQALIDWTIAFSYLGAYFKMKDFVNKRMTQPPTWFYRLKYIMLTVQILLTINLLVFDQLFTKEQIQNDSDSQSITNYS
jgi:hypothetical protein